jgi:Helicase HerA, central domain
MLDWLFGESQSADDRRTQALIDEVRVLRASSFFKSDDDVPAYIEAMLVDAAESAGVSIGRVVGLPLYKLVLNLLLSEPFLYSVYLEPDTPPFKSISLADGLAARKHLSRVIAVLQNEKEILASWRFTVIAILVKLLENFPAAALADPKIDGTEETYSVLSGTAPLYTMIEDLPTLLHSLIYTVAVRPPLEKDLFQTLYEQFDDNVYLASGVSKADKHKTTKQTVFPINNTKLSPFELVAAYMGETDFIDVLMVDVPIPISQSIRFEHTHILAGTGHGKTQTLQYLIADDLRRGVEVEAGSVVVLDPHGDLIKTLTRTTFFTENLYGRRTIIIDPSDIEFPIGLNLFDVGFDTALDPKTKETIQNNTIDFFEYFFSALLGSELTGKQGTLFRYIGILLMHVPNANITTLIDLMERGEKYKPYMAKLSGSAKLFFDSRFFDPSFRETKKQISIRLFGVLSSQTLDRMFSVKKSSINFYDALQAGAVILVNTATDFLGQQSSEIFARLIISLVGQALIRRAAIEPNDRTPTYLYIDEAGPLVDDTLVRMLTQVRKYKGAITFSHQYLDQIPAAIRAGVISNTAIKIAGGISQKDAAALAPEFRTDADFLLSMKKRSTETEFALYAKNATDTPLKLHIPLGYLENSERLSDEDFDAMRDFSRLICVPDDDTDEVAEVDVPEIETTAVEPAAAPARVVAKDIDADAPPKRIEKIELDPLPASPEPQLLPEPLPDPIEGLPELPRKAIPSEVMDVPALPVEVVAAPVLRKEGGGGVKHQYLQRLVKELGEQSGWRVTLEETVLEGTGRIDVVARRGDDRILVEVSVTTTREHEYANIKKCLEFGGTHVLLVATPARHLTSMKRHIEPLLTSTEKGIVQFMSPEELPTFFDALAVHTPTAPSIVKGYKVRSKVVASSPDEAIARRRAVAHVIANSEAFAAPATA